MGQGEKHKSSHPYVHMGEDLARLVVDRLICKVKQMNLEFSPKS